MERMKLLTNKNKLTVEKLHVRRYFAKLPPKRRAALRAIRKAVHAAAPRATEGFSYQIPCVRLDDRILVWYASFKEHCSLYPITERIRRTFAAELKGYKTSKGTVRFPIATPVPMTLIRRLVRARMHELHRQKSLRNRT